MAAQEDDDAPRPGWRMTAGLPEPEHSMYSRWPPTSIILPPPAWAIAVAAPTVEMAPPIAKTKSVAITGTTSQRPPPRRLARTWMTIQIARPAMASGQT